ncbi:unnamed protein product [Miscanthus lutarioriparius]|uniref:aminodeoxychorismate synthase n=1 Tax=Miscanthus lutarioriparius TaxID=422564 RepID=A0A811S7F8_9POAL|nr:unnamed protein product [Miscanthus lutarioriparius]
MAALRLPSPSAARLSHLPTLVSASAAARRVSPSPSRGAAGQGEDTPEPPVRTLLIDNYDSYTYNIFQELSVVNGVPPVVVRNDEWTWRDVFNRVYKDRAFDNIVISPGPGSPACPADIGVCLRILLECGDVPILGVCLGHQALGFVHGAKIVHAPEAIHGRLSEIQHDGCYLFNCVPSGTNSGFKVVRYHSLVIESGSLPDDLTSIMWTASPNLLSYLERHASESDDSRVIMGIRHSSRPHYGVQFHPESIATHHGRQIFRNFKKITGDFGLCSSWLQERKVNSASHRDSIPKDLLRTETMELSEPVLGKRGIGKKCLRLRWKKIENFLCPTVGSEDIFVVLLAIKAVKTRFGWIAHQLTRARFSFMGGKSGSLWKQMTFHLSGQRANCGGTLITQDAYGYTAKNFIKEGFLEFLNKVSTVTTMFLSMSSFPGSSVSLLSRFLNANPVSQCSYATAIFSILHVLNFTSEKDQAENLMIVDLLRNDLGKVCKPGSVHVPRLMDVESYKTVHTMVSTVRGTKKSNLSPVDCVKAAFPGGSMTGAPKVRSMEILDSLETSPRGVYSGSIGFFSYNHTFDLNIVIRTVILHDGEASVGAGGAIVALSNPEAEYNEMLLKAKAPTKVVEDFIETIYSSDRSDSMQTTIS